MNNKRIHELLGILKSKGKRFNILDPIGTSIAKLKKTDPLYKSVQYLLEQEVQRYESIRFCNECDATMVAIQDPSIFHSPLCSICRKKEKIKETKE